MKISFLFCVILFQATLGCTNYIVTKGACAEGVNMFSYTADSFPMYGDLYHWHAGYHDSDEIIDVYDWNTDTYLGQISQGSYTYNVIGNMNEYSLAIGETTFGGRENSNSKAVVDYGTLIYLTLQRCKTAREAIQFINETCNTYGFASEGESFTIADPDEIWIMEILTKTTEDAESSDIKFEWTATRVPDGHISGHANQCRTRTLITNNTDECMYSPDIYEWAVASGFTDAASLEEMDVTEVFNPIEASGARTCDGRVFAFYHTVVTEEQSLQWEDYVYGRDLTDRMPFSIDLATNESGYCTKKTVSLEELQSVVGNHYEGTSFAPEYDMSSLWFHMQQRPRPLTWTVEGDDGVTYNYTHERPAGCQQTAWHFVAVCKRELADGTTVGLDWEPEALEEGESAADKEANIVLTGGVFWFSCDDATCSVHIPIFPCTTVVPAELSRDKANIFLMNRNTLFWVNNLLANWAYTNWRQMKPLVRARMAEERQYFHAAAAQAEVVLADLAHADPKVAVEYANQCARTFAKKLTEDWHAFYQELFRIYFDGLGHIKSGETTASAKQFYSEQAYYDAIVGETGDHYLLSKYSNANANDIARQLRRMARTFAK